MCTILPESYALRRRKAVILYLNEVWLSKVNKSGFRLLVHNRRQHKDEDSLSNTRDL